MSINSFYKISRIFILLCIILGCCISCGKNPESRFQELFNEGSSHFAHREYRKAIAVWKGALKIQPESIEAQKNIAKAYMYLAEFTKAEKSLSQILKKKPEADDILLELTKLQLLTGSIFKALDNWKKLDSRHPDDPFVKALSGDLFMLQGRFKEAENAYKDAAIISSNNTIVLIKLAVCYLSRNNSDMAQETFEKATANKIESSDELLLMANYWKLKDNIEKTQLYIQKAIKLDPEDLSLKMKLARFYYNINRYQDSRELVEKLIDQSPGNRYLKKYLIKILFAQNQIEQIPLLLEEFKEEMKKDLEYNLLAGKYYLIINNPTIAQAYFKRVTREQSGHFLAHYLLGVSYLLGQHVHLAQQSFKEALSLNPSFFEAEIASAGLNYKNQGLDLSYDHIKRVIEKEPENFRAHLIMGSILLAKKEYGDALIRFRSALLINPDSQAAVYYIALTNEYFNKKEEALKLYQVLLKKNPDLADAAWRFKELLIETGKIDMAKQYFKLAVDNSPGNGYLHYILGEIYLENNNTLKAIDSFNNAIRLISDLGSSYIKLAGIYAGQKKQEKQTEVLELCIKNVSGSLDCHFQLSWLYLQNERWDDAIITLEAALMENSDSPLLANNLAYLYLERDEKINKAFELARFAYEKMPESSAAADSLGWAYYKKKLFTQAVTYLEAASVLSPDNPIIHYHLGLARFYAGRYSESQISLEKAIFLNLPSPYREKAEALLE